MVIKRIKLEKKKRRERRVYFKKTLEDAEKSKDTIIIKSAMYPEDVEYLKRTLNQKNVHASKINSNLYFVKWTIN